MTLKDIVSKSGGIEKFTKNLSSELKKKKKCKTKLCSFLMFPLPAVEKWILPVGVCSGILVVIVIAVIIWRCRLRGYTQAPVQENPEHPEVPLTILTEHDETAQEP